MASEKKKPDVVGVLMAPALAHAESVEPNKSIHETINSLWATIVKRVDESLTLETAELPSVVQIFSEADISSLDPRTSPFAALKLANPTTHYIVMFGMPTKWPNVVNLSKPVDDQVDDKENVTTGMANMSIQDEGNEKPDGAGPSKKKKKKKGKPQPKDDASIDLLRQDFARLSGEVKDLQSSNTQVLGEIKDILSSNAKLEASNTQVLGEVKDLRSPNARLEDSNEQVLGEVKDLQASDARLWGQIKDLETSTAQLSGEVKDLQASDARLWGQIKDLEASDARLWGQTKDLEASTAQLSGEVKDLQASDADLSNALKRQSKILNALNRRFILKDARNKIAADYDFSMDELLPRSDAIPSLIGRIRSKLNEEHSKLLSDDVLAVIFEPPKSIQAESMLDGSLDTDRRAVLEKICSFAYGTGPTLEDLMLK